MIGQPTVSYFLKQAAGIAKGASKTGEKCCCSRSHISPGHSSLSVWRITVIDVIFMTCRGWGVQQREEVAQVVCFQKKENYGFPPFMLSAVFRLVSAVKSQYNQLTRLSNHLTHTFTHTSPSFDKVVLCSLNVQFCLYSHCLISVCEGHETAGIVSVRTVYEIAQVKAKDDCFKMRNSSLETIVKSIVGSAQSLGIKVVNE